MSAPFPKLQSAQVWRGMWEAVNDQHHIPVLLAKGDRPGPTVLILGGVHGDEYEGPSAIHQLFNELDPGVLAGTLIGLPVVNVAAWNARTRTSPIDGADLNRTFPGQPEGSSGALAEAIFDKAVKPCDILLDLHSGGRALVHLPLVGWYAGAAVAERLARSFNRDLHPWLIPDAAGVLSYEANRIGKVALGSEWGGGGKLDLFGAAAYCTGIKRMLALVGVLATNDAEADPDARPAIAGDYQRSSAGGLFHPTVTLGDAITENDPLGTLTTLCGETAAVVLSQRSGIIAGLPHQPWIEQGDRIAYVG
jgi:predicted deacylase